MPAYLLQNTTAKTLVGGDVMVVFAADAANAKAIADAYTGSDPKGSWANATATEIVAGTELAGLELNVKILDSDPAINIVAPSTGLSVFSAEIGAGGTGYDVNDIVTVSGGTFTRAATFRVTSESSNVVTGVELVDPGEYTVLPSNDAATTGGGTGLELTLTGGTNRIENAAAAAVGLLNATSIIAGAAVDFGAASNPLLTVASGGGGDDLGDKEVQVEARINGAAIPGLVGTITDEGSSSAALTVVLPAVTVSPQVVGVFKS